MATQLTDIKIKWGTVELLDGSTGTYANGVLQVNRPVWHVKPKRDFMTDYGAGKLDVAAFEVPAAGGAAPRLGGGRRQAFSKKMKLKTVTARVVTLKDA